jgi:hypothetical protein
VCEAFVTFPRHNLDEENTSTMIAEVCVICDDVTTPSADALNALERAANACTRPFHVRVINISAGNTRSLLRPIAVAGRGRSANERKYFASTLSAVDMSVEVARLLEGWNVIFVGCDRRQYCLDQEDIVMMSCYAEVPMQNFVVVDGTRPKDVRRMDALKLPVVVCGTEQAHHEHIGVASDDEELKNLLAQGLSEYPKVFVRETSAASQHAKKFRLLVAAFGAAKKNLLWTATNAPAELKGAVDRVASAIAANVLTHYGTCEVHLVCFDDGQFFVDGVTLGFALWDPLVLQSPDAATLFDGLMDHADAAHATKQPNYVVVFDATTKGYHLRASRDIAKGAMVFPDEGRTFAIVTKEHVRATWSDEDKVVFTRYAWPLDSDGHVYAIWEEDPKRWRPINHACNPTCIHVAPHSLNVVAARDIAEGEDLTMDYATFCDYTMKPFQCHCGAAECRGLIQPDAASLSNYGKHAWHLRPRDPEDTL